MTTVSAKPGTVDRQWWIVDAEGQNLGRLASVIAETLAGKRSPWYTRHCDTGDFVVVVNAEKVAVTGNKLRDKRYWRHSGYPGGIRSRTLGEQLERRPEEVLRKAVRGMLPKNSLGRAQLMKLKIYAGPEHPHAAQQPQAAAPHPRRGGHRMSTETTAGAARYRATGKRKSAVARVTLTPGSGEITCNGRPIDEFFGRKVLVTEARRPLTVTGTEGRFDVVALLHGGGVSGQAGALRHGIARALTVADEALRPDLKREGFLTRDARIKERKKAGLKGARKRPQFSKR